MNASVVRFAIRTAFLIQSQCKTDGKPSSSTPIMMYFRKMGISAEDIESFLPVGPSSQRKKAGKVEFPEDIQAAKVRTPERLAGTINYKAEPIEEFDLPPGSKKFDLVLFTWSL